MDSMRKRKQRLELIRLMNPEEPRRKVREEADKFGLFMTGGSDFHGLYEKTKTTLGAYPAHESSRVLFEKKF